MKIGIKRGRQAALALLASSALAGGVLAAGPANAAGTHNVGVQANPGVSGLSASLFCDPVSGTGADYNDNQPMSATGAATFTGVPDGYECSASVYDNNYFASHTYDDSDFTQSTYIPVQGAARTDWYCTGFGTISGSLAVGQTVSAAPGTSANGSFPVAAATATTPGLSYDWYRVDYVGGNPHFTEIQDSGTRNSGLYTLTEADYGHQIQVDVGGQNASTTQNVGAYLTCGSAISNPVGRLGTPAPRRPAIAGKAIVGHRLAARSATPPAGSSVSGYQWYYEKIVKTSHGKKPVFVKIRGAKHSVYRLKGGDRGKLIVVGITYTRPSYNPTILMSKAKRVH